MTTRLTATCEYCDQPATVISRDSGVALCKTCARDHHAAPLREATSNLTPTTRSRYGRYDRT